MVDRDLEQRRVFSRLGRVKDNSDVHRVFRFEVHGRFSWAFAHQKVLFPIWNWIVLSSVNSSMAKRPTSRPCPLSLNPPNGSSGYPSKNVFTQTGPARIRRLADRAVSKSRVQTLADKP